MEVISVNDPARKARVSVLLLSIVLYIISLTQTAITVNDYDGKHDYPALDMALVGSIAILGGGILEQFVWLANPIYFFAIVLFYKSNSLSVIFSITATIFALWFNSWKEILASESGRAATIETLNVGYWLWLLSFITLSTGSLYYFIRLKKNQL